MAVVFEREYSLDELEVIAQEIKKYLPRCSIVTFQGTLGAGKTTLIGVLLRVCGVEEVITSPTFTYVNAYKNKIGELFYHFDCYRLDSTQAFLDLGFDEYLYQPKSWAFIEWPEILEPLLKNDVCKVVLEYRDQDKRFIKIVI